MMILRTYLWTLPRGIDFSLFALWVTATVICCQLPMCTGWPCVLPTHEWWTCCSLHGTLGSGPYLKYSPDNGCNQEVGAWWHWGMQMLCPELQHNGVVQCMLPCGGVRLFLTIKQETDIFCACSDFVKNSGFSWHAFLIRLKRLTGRPWHEPRSSL